jgi:hypothetical protein
VALVGGLAGGEGERDQNPLYRSNFIAFINVKQQTISYVKQTTSIELIEILNIKTNINNHAK